MTDLETVEAQAVLIRKLNDRISILEAALHAARHWIAEDLSQFYYSDGDRVEATRDWDLTAQHDVLNRVNVALERNVDHDTAS